MGGEMKQVFLTMGEYDLIFIYEAVDDATAARFTLGLGMLGNVRTTTMKAFPEAAYYYGVTTHVKQLISHPFPSKMIVPSYLAINSLASPVT